MKLFKLTLVTLSLLALQFNSFSQYEKDDKNDNDKYSQIRNSKHALGIAAGVSTGYGLAYQYKPGKLSFMLAFAPYKDDYNTMISTGLTFIYRLKEGEKLNFFLYQANHFITDRSTYTTYSFPGNVPTTTTTNNDRINNGIGFGFEFFLGRSVTFNIMAGYGARNNFEEIGLTGETGLFYNF